MIMAIQNNCWIFNLDKTQWEKLSALLTAGNYESRFVPYAITAVAGKKFTCTIYEPKKVNGKQMAKVVVQGSGGAEFIEFVIEPEILQGASIEPPPDYSPHIGSDESGKGDYFGPLVTACVYIDEQLGPALRELGIKDCKQLSDAQVLTLGRKARELLGPEHFEIMRINPPAYNRLYAKIHNLNRILAWCHATVIEDLLTKIPSCPKAIIDQFSVSEDTILNALKPRGKQIIIDQHHKAESDIAVAAASVIAREEFLRAVCEIASEIQPDCKVPLGVVPKGCSDDRVIELATKLVREHEPKWLMNHCKVHFQTTDTVLGNCLLTRAALPPEGQITSKQFRAMGR